VSPGIAESGNVEDGGGQSESGSRRKGKDKRKSGVTVLARKMEVRALMVGYLGRGVWNAPPRILCDGNSHEDDRENSILPS
jgi:hypothetical protein